MGGAALMKTFIFASLLVLASAPFAGAAPEKIGDELDYVLPVIKACKSESGGTFGSNEITEKNSILYGGYTFEPVGGTKDFNAGAEDFSANLRKSIEAGGWKLVSFQLMPAGFLPRRILVLASREGSLLDLFVCLFPMQNGEMGISYTQARK
jgi:hypothetical protein